MPRDYTPLMDPIRALRAQDAESVSRRAVDLLWDGLAATGVSWVGFYRGEPGAGEMILGACRDKPACSPIGTHGACGRAWKTERGLVVRDVASLREGYVACDPRDRSEVVVPLFEDGRCWGVLDLDSFDVGAFGVEDAIGLARLMREAGLSDRDIGRAEVDVV